MESSEPKKKEVGQEPGKGEGRKPVVRDEVPHVVRPPRLSLSLWSLQSRFGRRW